MKTAKITIRSGMFKKWDFSFYFVDLPDFKQALLKRFGNLRGTSKSTRYQENVKTAIRKAESIQDIKEMNPGTGWAFEIEVQE